MNSGLGLVELLFVFALVMGGGAYELWKLRRPKPPKREPDDKASR